MKDHHQKPVIEDQIKFLKIKNNELFITEEFKNLDDLKQKGLKSMQQRPDVQQNLPQQNNKTKAKKSYDQVKMEVQQSHSNDRNLAGDP
jgi:hypothetical protein